MHQHNANLLPGSLRALIIGSAFWVLSLPLTTVSGSMAALLGAIAACLAVDVLITRPPWRDLRLPAISLGAVLFMLLGLSLTSLLTTSSILAGIFGAMGSFGLAQVIGGFTISASLTVVLRSLAQRHNAGRVLEILFVAAAFVIALAAHRQGMIHRPYFIGDFAQIRGIDPSSILMVAGAVAVLALSALLMMENNHRRLPYHFTAIALLCFSLLAWVQFLGMPTPSLTDDLGLTGQSGSGSSAQDDNPFRDGENDPGDREAPVAIVLFRDDYEPEEGIYYFRESAYSEFNGSMLATASNPVLDQDLVRGFSGQDARVDPDEIPARDMRREVRTTIGLLTPHRSPFGLDTPEQFNNVPNPNSLRFRQTYEAVSQVPEFGFPELMGREAGAPDWSVDQWQEYVAMPDDPRYGEHARELVSGLRPEFAEDPYAKAMAVKSWLDENGIYSLKNEHAYASDPAASFLFGDLTGYCVHFAYAATYMYRSLGIPSRVGVGYAVPAQNRAGGSALLIQAVNGHAWPEIYLAGLGWVIVDPTPAQTLVDMSVDPQDGLQQMLGDMLRDEAAFEEYLQSQQSSSPLSLAGLLRTLALSLLALLLAAWLIRIWRQQAPRLAGNTQLHRWSYRAALDRLAAHGLVRQPGESRENFARRCQDRLPAFQEMTRAHLALAMGSRAALTVSHTTTTALEQAGSGERQQWRLWQEQLGEELKSSMPLWRRAVALIDPFAWLRSR